jgi:hypothetical protein
VLLEEHGPRLERDLRLASRDLKDLLALTTAEMADACRVGGDRRQAGEHFTHAR